MAREPPWGDAVVTGYGTVLGRKVFVFSQDFTVFGGSLSEVFAEKVCKVMDLAVTYGCPVMGINDSGGARIQEGVVSLAGYAEIFWRNVQASGVVPQISLVMGPCAGGAVYSPGDHRLRPHGRGDVVHVHHRSRRREDRDGRGRELRAARRRGHATRSGVAHFTTADEEACLEEARYLLSFLPQNNLDSPPYAPPSDPVDREDASLDTLVPDSPNKPYDIKSVIERVVDDGNFLEVHAHLAENIVCGFARLGGHSVGVVGNQPGALAGVLDIDASVKAARFVRTCDAFNIPLVTFVDVPGFLPGTAQEWGGIIRHGAKLLYAYAEATVPKLTVITRKAYGGAYDVMSSKHIARTSTSRGRRPRSRSWARRARSTSCSGTSSPEAEDPDARREELIAEYKERFANPYTAAERGYVDDVIQPRRTRPCPRSPRSRRLSRSASPRRAASTGTSRSSARATRSSADRRARAGHVVRERRVAGLEERNREPRVLPRLVHAARRRHSPPRAPRGTSRPGASRLVAQATASSRSGIASSARPRPRSVLPTAYRASASPSPFAGSRSRARSARSNASRAAERVPGLVVLPAPRLLRSGPVQYAAASCASASSIPRRVQPTNPSRSAATRATMCAASAAMKYCPAASAPRVGRLEERTGRVFVATRPPQPSALEVDASARDLVGLGERDGLVDERVAAVEVPRGGLRPARAASGLRRARRPTSRLRAADGGASPSRRGRRSPTTVGAGRPRPESVFRLRSRRGARRDASASTTRRNASSGPRFRRPGSMSRRGRDDQGAWRRAGLQEGVERDDADVGYTPSPRSTRGATRA